ncbi:MAG TPA: CehA/McbA family metallohydrolase [Dehalococcoidia bacterium]|nr:CehA/McbA family metallohydrolase [Dehalococcoidia bacterium]
MLIDLHSHTWPLSDDSLLDPDDLIIRTKEAGIDGICLTEHDFFWDHEKVRQLAHKHQFLVLPGCEVNTEQGHMLTFGLTEYRFGMHRVEELARMVDAVDGAMIAAHPYRRQMPWQPNDPNDYHRALERAKQNRAYRYVAALEIENGRGSERENEFSRRLATELEMPGTAGTDSHARKDIARCATYFEADIRSLEDLIQALKAGRFYPVTLQRARA